MNEPTEKQREQRAACLTPWKKGQSGNPKGRPRRKTFTEMVREVLAEEVNGTTKLEILVRKMVKEAITDGRRAAEARNAILDRLDPKSQYLRVSGDDDKPPITVIHANGGNGKE